jgi:hypothetical protein
MYNTLIKFDEILYNLAVPKRWNSGPEFAEIPQEFFFLQNIPPRKF